MLVKIMSAPLPRPDIPSVINIRFLHGGHTVFATNIGLENGALAVQCRALDLIVHALGIA